MVLINIQDVSLGFGGPGLFEKINLQIHHGERICLLGRNGTGKSTLIKLMMGDNMPDSGKITMANGVTLAALPQDVPQNIKGSANDVVTKGLPNQGDFSQWRGQHKVDRIVSCLGFNPDSDFAGLSAGMKRRVLMARAMAQNPDILLLDEPTNHLDINTIEWLEGYLLKSTSTLFFITHDRSLLRALATRIVELDRGQLMDWGCDYDTFLKRKQGTLSAEKSNWDKFDKKLAREEIWIRRGIKARRTRNEGRVRDLQKMRAERKARRETIGSVSMKIQEAEKTGRLVAEVTNLCYSYEELLVVDNFSTTILRGDRVGILGPNGAGKTTLLQLLLGNLQPDSGNIRLGTKLKIAYFDQLRGQLNENETVQENIAEGNDFISVDGKQRHVIGYLGDFLFSPERARTPVRILSGGERNRLLLARLFAKPFNLLVMDEPTNDLDAETLELLEEKLLNYQGTLLLVSHDRAFLNNVVTSLLVFEGNSRINEYVGGYDDWVIQRKTEPEPKEKRKTLPKANKQRKIKEGKQKLSYKEQKELEDLPGLIEKLETEQEDIYKKLSDPAFYQDKGPKIGQMKDHLAEIEKKIENAYQRWEFLE